MYKLPESTQINYLMDSEGNLFINNEEVEHLSDAINNPDVRKNEICAILMMMK